MAFANAHLKVEFLGSAVARRLFWLLSVGTLLPVVCFALYSHDRVKSQLEADATIAIRSALTQSTVSLSDKLAVASTLFELRLNGLQSDFPSSSALAYEDLFGNLRGVDSIGGADRSVSSRRMELLRSGRSLVLTSTAHVGSTISVVRGVFDGSATDSFWAGDLDLESVVSVETLNPNDLLWIHDAEGRLLYSSPDAFGWSAEDSSRVLGNERPHESVLDRRGEPYLVTTRSIPLNGMMDPERITLSLGRSFVDIYRPLEEFDEIFPQIASAAISLAVLMLVSQIRRTLVPIQILSEGAANIAAGRFDTRIFISTGDEFETLGSTFNRMAEVVERQIDVLTTVNEIGAQLSAEREEGPLIDAILKGMLRVTCADASFYYSVDDRGDPSHPRHVLNASCGAIGSGMNQPWIDLFAADSLPLVARQDDGLGRSSAEHRAGAIRASGSEYGGIAGEWLAVPMLDERHRGLGTYVLVKSGDRGFSADDESIVTSLVSQASVASQKNRLVEQFRRLFEGVVDLTVQAIDEKSAYTGDHCRKVPILTEMIADAVCHDATGPMKDFDLDPDQRYELSVAALLHDCGKVVTPVHVMDKATKLETLRDGIEIIEARFEVLRTEARRQATLRAVNAGDVRAKQHGRDDGLARELAAIDDDLAFLRKCNIGQERMTEEDCVRVERIACDRRWSDEFGRIHPALGPEDVTNLTVRRGTLNDDERMVIRNHVVSTIRMLESLPWPENMQNVPAIAGAHHERIDGTGYPLGLDARRLSVQARILALADIFEALTAKSRPYKPGRTLAETMAILERMSEDGHIDPGLLSIFQRDGIHLQYAALYLSPEQIDPEYEAAIEALTFRARASPSVSQDSRAPDPS